MQKEAVVALGRLRAEVHSAAVAALLRSGVADLRKVAIGALAEMGAVSSVSAIRDLVRDADTEVSKAAQRALAILEKS